VKFDDVVIFSFSFVFQKRSQIKLSNFFPLLQADCERSVECV
jgi:hypothetical protein